MIGEYRLEHKDITTIVGLKYTTIRHSPKVFNRMLTKAMRHPCTADTKAASGRAAFLNKWGMLSRRSVMISLRSIRLIDIITTSPYSRYLLRFKGIHEESVFQGYKHIMDIGHDQHLRL